MRLRRMLLACLACLAFAPIEATAAHAAEHWNIGGGELVFGSESVSYFGGPWTLSSSIFGTEVKLTAENVECAAFSCTISGQGESSANLRFTGLKVASPANCTAGNVFGVAGTLTTESLHGKVIMDPSKSGGPILDRLSPSAGLVLAEIEFHGEKCVFNELVLELEGQLNAELPSATGVEKVSQSLSFNVFAQSTGGGFLDLSGHSATLTGTASMSLSGGGTGKGFAATE